MTIFVNIVYEIMTIFQVVLFSMLVITVKPWVLPVEKCHLDDSTCMTAAFQKVIPIYFNGIPELSVEKISQLDDISVDLSGLKFTLKNWSIKGLNNTIMDSVNWNLKRKFVDIECHLSCALKGHYTATGQVLILPINDDGQIKVKLNKIASKLRMHYAIEKRDDGKDHIRPKKFSFQHDIKEPVEFHLTNLFKGNKELSDNLLKFINDNWKEIADEFGAPILDHISDKITNTIIKFYENLPIEEIAVV